ncbi:MAG: pirin family protein [Pseudomonadota bacterium]
MNTKERNIARIIQSQPTSDGAGVKLRRSIGSSQLARLDPFLMMDEFFSDNPDDYLAGFPAHPHRGFETVTYMLDGHMEHQDHLGNVGDLGPGSVQWMTAGRGVIHSEMPKQEDGRMRGFQLWINLPAAEKMRPASYQDIPADQVPQVNFDGGTVKVLAGRFDFEGKTIGGAVNGGDQRLSTDPLYLDLRLDAGQLIILPIEADYNAFLYLYEGEAEIGDKRIPHRAAGVLTEGDSVTITAGEEGARLLLLAGKPIGEPVYQHGPFVMNTREEIEQAMWDYRDGRLTDAA